MPNPHNLIPHQFKPGQSGNPGGRPKRRAVDDLLDLIGEKKADKAISARWLKAILEGDFRYMKEYLDRRDGKVKDEVQLEETRVVVDRRDRAKRDPGETPPDPATGEGSGEPV